MLSYNDNTTEVNQTSLKWNLRNPKSCSEIWDFEIPYRILAGVGPRELGKTLASEAWDPGDVIFLWQKLGSLAMVHSDYKIPPKIMLTVWLHLIYHQYSPPKFLIPSQIQNPSKMWYPNYIKLASTNKINTQPFYG